MFPLLETWNICSCLLPTFLLICQSFLLNYRSYLYSRPFVSITSFKYFLQVHDLCFSSLYSVSWWTEILNFNIIEFLNVFSVLFKKFILTSEDERYYPMFLLVFAFHSPPGGYVYIWCEVWIQFFFPFIIYIFSQLLKYCLFLTSSFCIIVGLFLGTPVCSIDLSSCSFTNTILPQLILLYNQSRYPIGSSAHLVSLLQKCLGFSWPSFL